MILDSLIAVAAVTMAANAIGTDSAGEGIGLGLTLGVGLGATFSSWPPVFARMPWHGGSSTTGRSC